MSDDEKMSPDDSMIVEGKNISTEGMSRFERVNYKVSLWFERIAIVAILLMILATMVDVIGSNLPGNFKWPLPGGTEIVYLLQLIAMAGAMAIAKIDGRHVRIELIDKLRQPALGIIHALVAILGLALFVLLSWKSFEYAQDLFVNNDVTATERIPLYPFAIWLGLTSIPMVMILINDFITSILEMRKR
jgi:TRAP-type C4-dicarboxylate transport system permease small subunit